MTNARYHSSHNTRGHNRMARMQHGFTLIEAIIVIVITGIVGAMVAMFIRLPVLGYIDTVARAQLTDIADTALRRMARDLRLALPNSVRISPDGRYLEFLLTKTGGRYLAEEDGQGVTGILNFENTSALSFNLVGTPPSGQQAIVAGKDSIVVYNLGIGAADAYKTGNRALVAGIAGNTITMASNPFAAQNPPFKSPTRRFQIVSTPVTYFCNTGTGQLIRYWDYTIQDPQPKTAAALATASNPKNALLASNVQGCTFSYASLANTHSGLVTLTLTLASPNTDAGSVVLVHQVHVDNTP